MQHIFYVYFFNFFLFDGGFIYCVLFLWIFNYNTRGGRRHFDNVNIYNNNSNNNHNKITTKLHDCLYIYVVCVCMCVCNKFHKMLYRLLHYKAKVEIEIEEEEEADDDDDCL